MPIPEAQTEGNSTLNVKEPALRSLFGSCLSVPKVDGRAVYDMVTKNLIRRLSPESSNPQVYAADFLQEVYFAEPWAERPDLREIPRLIDQFISPIVNDVVSVIGITRTRCHSGIAAGMMRKEVVMICAIVRNPNIKRIQLSGARSK